MAQEDDQQHGAGLPALWKPALDGVTPLPRSAVLRLYQQGPRAVDEARVARIVLAATTAAPKRAHVTRTTPKRLLSRQEAAGYVGITRTKFSAMVAGGLMPEPFQVAGRLLWDVRDLDSAIDAIKDEVESPAPTTKSTSWDDA